MYQSHKSIFHSKSNPKMQGSNEVNSEIKIKYINTKTVKYCMYLCAEKHKSGSVLCFKEMVRAKIDCNNMNACQSKGHLQHADKKSSTKI